MKDVKIPPYSPPELEIITFECTNIITTSYGNDNLETDDNVDFEW